MAYEESNGHVTEDVMSPWKIKVVTAIHVEPNITKMAEYWFQRTTNWKWQWRIE